MSDKIELKKEIAPEETDYRDFEDPGIEYLENTECPECGSFNMIRHPVADGNDDYKFEYKCLDCNTILDT